MYKFYLDHAITKEIIRYLDDVLEMDVRAFIFGKNPWGKVFACEDITGSAYITRNDLEWIAGDYSEDIYAI